jgi:hypothetical protein
MKSFTRPSFFRTFDLLLSMSNPGLKKSRWMVEKVTFERERYSFTNARYNIVIEIFTATYTAGRRPWSLMVAKEFWSSGTTDTLRNTRWAKPLQGSRTDILAWFQARETSLGRQLPSMGGRISDSSEKVEDPSPAEDGTPHTGEFV